MRDIAPHIRKQNLPPKNVGNVDSVVLYPDSMKIREKLLVFGGLMDSAWGA
jgi:hypothetical protein